MTLQEPHRITLQDTGSLGSTGMPTISMPVIDNIPLLLSIVLIIYSPVLLQWFRRAILRLGWDFVMTTSEEERDREPPDRGQETTRNAQADTSGFAAQAPREEGEAADAAQERAQPRSEQAGSGDAGDTHQEYLTNWARAHQYPIPDTQKYEDERKFLMSSLESLIVTTKKTQDSLAEVARRQ